MATKGPKRSIEEIRHELLNDKYTKQIAKTLGMKLEEYVEMVLDFVKNPDKSPELNMLPDEEVKRLGGATMEDVKAWFEGVADGSVKIPGAEKGGQGKEAKRMLEKDDFKETTASGRSKKIKKLTGG